MRLDAAPQSVSLTDPDGAIELTIRRSTRAHRYALRIVAGRAELVVPRRAALAVGLAFARSRLPWLRARLRQVAAAPPPSPYQHGSHWLLRGVPVQTMIEMGPRARVWQDGLVLRVVAIDPADDARVASDVDAWLAAECEADVYRHIAHFAPQLGVKPRRVTIRVQRSRWGSCSARGDIAINQRLIHHPPEHLAYVVAHELCHLREMNHGPRFWALVEGLGFSRGQRLPAQTQA